MVEQPKRTICIGGQNGVDARSVRDVCREYPDRRDAVLPVARALLEGGRRALANPREKTPERAELDRLRRRVGQLERAPGRKTHELEVAGELSRDWEGACASPGPAQSWLLATGRRW